MIRLAHPQRRPVVRFFGKVRENQCSEARWHYSVKEDNAMVTFIVCLAAMAMTSGLLFVYDRL